jgi:hypothetical protein
LRKKFPGAIVSGFTVVAFCVILLGHNPLVFWNDDYELSILPVFADVARSWSEGHFPLLSPYSWVCSNLAGEFQYGTFSVFVNAAVVLIWKFPLTFAQQAAALSIVHLFVLAVGAFLLAHDRKFPIHLSIFVALIAALNGWIICWAATDWFGALGAFAWIPWAWWGLARALDCQRTRWRLLWPAPFVYLVVTGGFPYTVLMLALLIVWLAMRALVETKSWSTILPLLAGVVLGLGLSAPAWLAILDYAHGSVREQMQPADAHWQWIVPWRALPGFILPCWTVKWADFSTRYLSHSAAELANGLVAPAALVAGFLWRPRMLLRRMKWELVLLLIILLLCMIPTAGVFRWSFRWLPFLHLVLAICAAQILQLRPGLPTASASVLLLIAITIPMAIFKTQGDYGVALLLIYFQIAVAWLLGEWFIGSETLRNWGPAVVTFAIFVATYICIPPNCGVPKYNLSDDLLKAEPLDPQRLYLSIYPEPESRYRVEQKPGPVGELIRPGSTSMWAALRFINGYSPILPSGVAREFDLRIHGEINPHEAEYLVWNQSHAGGLLEQIGIDGLVVAWDSGITPALGPDWEFVTSNEEASVYHRTGPPLARIRSIEAIDSRPGMKFSHAAISGIIESRNRIIANVDVPSADQSALLIFSRPFFRGYEARLGNQTLRVDSYRNLFPTVDVPPDSHGQLALVYRPPWLIFGGALSILCAAIWLLGLATAAFTRSQA